MKQRLIFALLISTALAGCSTSSIIPDLKPSVSRDSCVVLVHGLWRSSFAMRSIESDLEDAGYETVSISYPSMDQSIPELSDAYLSDGVQRCKENNAEQIHLVSHSMGGILVRQYLQENRLPEGSKVVMLSPPNQGSELSERFGKTWWYKLIVGPAGSSLTKDVDGIISKLKPVDASIGIIGAYRNWSLWPDSWLPKPNDGTVSVESMKLDEMDDFILIENGHAMMRYDDTIQAQIRHFLEKGVFYTPPKQQTN